MQFPFANMQKGRNKPWAGPDFGNVPGLPQYRFDGIYRTIYIVGIQTTRIVKRFWRRTKHFFQPVTNLTRAAYARTLGRQIKRLLGEVHSIREGFQIAGGRLSEAKKIGFFKTVQESLLVTGKSFVRHKGLVFSILNIAAPVAAVVLLVNTVSFWNSTNFGLTLAYGGETIATIQDERVFEQATEMVNQRMVHDTTAEDPGMNIAPSYTLSIMNNSQYSSVGAVCNMLIKQSDGIIEEASGLYVDGRLMGAIKSSADLRYILEGILTQAKGESKDAEASFAENVEMVTGLFPTTSIMNLDTMKSTLTGVSSNPALYTVKSGDTASTIAKAHDLTLEELNQINGGEVGHLLHIGDMINVEVTVPKLSVNLIKKEAKETALAFKTVTKKDDNEYTDYSKVETEGADGIQKNVDKVTYLNGVETKRERVSTSVVKAPVDKVIVTGTKKRPPGSESGVGSGSFIWPAPSLHTITTGFEYRWGSFHNGIDIAGGSAYGKPIVAADGGTVIKASFDSSYGNHVKIDHGNGLVTLYAHSSKLLVSVGQKVSKGQTIALVGSTGNSTGPHLHFEVYRNGTRVDPFSYLN